jgi:hypothetical protein
MNCVFTYPRSGSNFLTVAYKFCTEQEIDNVHGYIFLEEGQYKNIFSIARDPILSISSYATISKKQNIWTNNLDEKYYFIDTYKEAYLAMIRNNSIIFKFEDVIDEAKINKIIKYMSKTNNQNFKKNVNLQIINNQLKEIEEQDKHLNFITTSVKEESYKENKIYYEGANLDECYSLYNMVKKRAVNL